MDTTGKAIKITTGRYGKGSAEQNKTVDAILGKGCAKERFELYFHWYNVIHELGHGIIHFHAENRPHPVHEEQLVNDFAIAYWLHYGEDGKIIYLSSIIDYALAHLQCPAEAGIGHIAYAKENWGKEALYNFNNYGWFQFSSVFGALRERQDLESALEKMGIKNIKPQPQKTLVYRNITEDTTTKIAKDAASVLRRWGVVIPDVYVVFDDDPNRHMCRVIDV